MKNNIYTIYDKLTEEGGPLFEARNDKVAIRAFHRTLKGHDNKDDFTLLRLGVYDYERSLVLGNPPEKVIIPGEEEFSNE